MRLSEAIRLAQFKPQAFYAVRDDDGNLCAWGGALESVGILEAFLAEPDYEKRREIVRSTGWLEDMEAPSTCPQCGKGLPFFAIAHLNDRHGWTREQIAHYVEITFESQQPTAPPVEVACG